MKQETGFTLVELMIALSIIAILSMLSAPLMQDMIPKQRLIGKANNVVGFIQQGRIHAVGKKAVLLCAYPGDCSTFTQATGLSLIEDNNDNRVFDEGDKLVAKLTLPKGSVIHWKSFRRKPWLKFSPSAISYYQNGTLQLCAQKFSIRVIVTRIGRPRVSPEGVEEKNC